MRNTKRLYLWRYSYLKLHFRLTKGRVFPTLVRLVYRYEIRPKFITNKPFLFLKLFLVQLFNCSKNFLTIVEGREKEKQLTFETGARKVPVKSSLSLIGPVARSNVTTALTSVKGSNPFCSRFSGSCF